MKNFHSPWLHPLGVFLILLLAPIFAWGGSGMVLRTHQRGSNCAAVAPANTRQLVLERAVGNGWMPVASRHLEPNNRKKATLQIFRKPAISRRAIFRLVAYSQQIFPPKMTRGKNNFTTQTPNQNGPLIGHVIASNSDRDTTGLSTAGTTAGTGSLSTVAVESDIWKLLGNRLFFFNQYRGLQVLDVSDPLAPQKLGSLRLVASGEEFFAVDSLGSKLILLAREGAYSSTPKTVLHFLSVSPAGIPKLDSTMVLDGNYADSRLTGDRLTLVTTQAYTPVTTTFGTVEQTYNPVVCLHSVSLTNFSDPTELEKIQFAGVNPVMQSVDGRLIIATQDNYGWISTSQLRVFTESAAGLTEEHKFALQGVVRDKFKLNIVGKYVIAVVQHQGTLGLETTIFTYPLAGAATTATTSLRLVEAANEQLHATRFDGNRLYVVTFRRVDPLFVVSLENPAAPELKGVLEIPGWSTYLQPMGNRLLSVGVEDRRVAVSWFDVTDANAPSLLSRVYLGESNNWSWSEGNYDEKAIEFYAAANTLMLPFQTYAGQTSEAAMQEVQIIGDTLVLGKKLSHKHFARRGAILGDYLISLSSQEYLVLKRSGTDTVPTVAVSLSWATDFLIKRGNYLLQIAASNFWNSNATPLIRLTTAAQPDDLLEELQIGNGPILATHEDGDALYIAQAVTEESVQILRTWRLDLSKLPDLVTGAAVDVPLPVGSAIQTGTVVPLKPNPQTLVWHVQGQRQFGFGGPLIPLQALPASGLVSSRAAVVSWWAQQEAPLLVSVILRGAQMEAGKAIALSQPLHANSVGRTYAQDGYVFAAQESVSYTYISPGDGDGLQLQFMPFYKTNYAHLLHVVDYRTTSPVLRNAVDIPGQLIGLGSVTDQGAVLFTRTSDALKACGYDGVDVWELDSLSLPENTYYGAYASQNGRVFLADAQPKSRVSTYGYAADTGLLAPMGTWNVDASVNTLAVKGPYLLASSYGLLDVATISADGALTPVGSFTLPTNLWLNVERSSILPDGLWCPAGLYGVEFIPWSLFTAP